MAKGKKTAPAKKTGEKLRLVEPIARPKSASAPKPKAAAAPASADIRKDFRKSLLGGYLSRVSGVPGKK